MVLIIGKAWKRGLDHLQVNWPVLLPILHQELIVCFSINPVKMQFNNKMDNSLQKSILAVSVPYQTENSADEQTDDVTIGSMTAPPNSGTIRV